MKGIVLCADDFGQEEAISKGILNLIYYGRLSATSCMVNTPSWSQDGKKLGIFKENLDIGLHFNLTHGEALSRAYQEKYGKTFPSFGRLLTKSFLRALDQSVIFAECEAQIMKFREITGFLPHFMDGHQHVHQFPVIREAFLSTYEKYLRAQPSYIRLSAFNFNQISLTHGFKKWMLNLTGGSKFRSLLLRKKIPHNPSFSGMYHFDARKSYHQTFKNFLEEINENGIIMCHPGFISESEDDPIRLSRNKEYQYFMSNQFLIDCKRKNIFLRRFNQA